MEKNALIKKFGPEYTTGIGTNGSEYLSYEKDIRSTEGNLVNKSTNYYFIRYKDSIDICTHIKLILPSSETPFYFLWLVNKMEYQGNLKWKDTVKGYSYKVQIIEPFFALTIFIDGEGVTETFRETDSFSKTYHINLSKN